ncbi:MAG: TVP38/TMEM64 family protein [Pegethrix bostrychoides GSE-TBD4-15B]|jgi:uncharacterized membrane protein YdjX (TVP38/TMEM64 family)|uniref:TVP38/TMEM64 family membrane protein n=1 Tax=Pegethrix bostrychoides GSE-TBD4-15B TaxID=2839662 RepID=A0A951U3N0_9CYAN|nr:TVP38/TMEM64 family protein [Pegethrix bostrychoides GSE-TBD4-15B]
MTQSKSRPKQRRLRSLQRLSQALQTPQNLLALALLVFCSLLALWLLTRCGLDITQPHEMAESIQALGWVGILIYISFLVIAIVIGPIPSTPVTIAAGAIWGPVTAGIFGVVGIYLGSLAAYFIGRTLGRSVVRALLGKTIYFSSQRGEVYLGWLVFVTHSMPFLPYDLVSYGAGISGMSFPIYAVACFMGVIPCIFFLTCMGAAMTGGMGLGIALVAVFGLLLLLLPIGIKRYNWWGLRDVIRVE